MNAVIVRIVLRYAAGFLVAKGFASADFGAAISGDPDVMAFGEMALGAIIGAGTEYAYRIAKRLGWAT